MAERLLPALSQALLQRTEPHGCEYQPQQLHARQVALQALQEAVRSGRLPLAAAEEAGLVGATAALLVDALAADDCAAAERAARTLASMAAALASQGCPWPVRAPSLPDHPQHCLHTEPLGCTYGVLVEHNRAAGTGTACATHA